jgi:SAM-dependent methyltransferase
MNVTEAYDLLYKTRNLYQPIAGSPTASKRKTTDFYNRIKSIADYCGNEDKYLIGGCANGFDCFYLADYGAQVVGVDNCSGRTCENSLEIARATAVFYRISPNNPRFIMGEFPGYFHYTEEKFDWVVMLMVLHNMLKFMGKTDVYGMINEIAVRSRKGFVMTTRGAISPKEIINNTAYRKFEEIPCPKRKDGKRDIAFGFPIFAFT